VFNPAFKALFIKDKAFMAGSGCTGCGLCVEKCPLNNISLVGGKPAWGGNCTHCMACICYCPEEAIEYGSASKGKFRYSLEREMEEQK
jgi:Pyruvate/2-oxoacid:ferredoxin oxidoreductase delta subunit